MLRVLLIGHSEADAGVVLQALRQGGFQPAGRRVDSRPALEGALTQPWELIVCDWHVPGIGGAEALDVLHTRRVDAPIIVVAGDLDEAEVLGAMKAGASDCLRTSALARLVPAVARELRQAEMRRAHLRAEAALRVSEERFAKAFDHAPIGMSMVAIDGTTLKVNRAMAEMFGYSEAELRNIPVWRFTHADDMPATIEQLQRLLEGQIDAWHLEKRFLHRDGSIVWGRSTTWLVRDAEGRALYVVSQVQDITEWRRLQEHMRRQQAELAHVLRVATMGETVAEIAHEVNQPLASIANFAHGVIARLDAGRVDVGAMRAVAEQIAGEALRASEVVRRLRDFLRKSEPNLVRCDANEVVC
ncbi:MAG TPA: PAS domain S-box protein, partial [Caldimonas sp.]|nr:PAS domain S-box protein [Caldimonas sp.]